MRSPSLTLPFPTLPFQAEKAAPPADVDDRDRPPPLVRVHTLSNEVEASYLDAVLEAHGIAHAIEPFGTGCYSGVFEFQNGFGAILVEEPDAGRARRLIEQALAEAALAEDDAGDEDSEADDDEVA